MDTSIDSFQHAGKRRHKAVVPRSSIGLCLRCRHRMTLCGAPFTSNIECNKCHYINVLQDSQQPVSGRDVDSSDFL
jgi:hypothetical protein